MKINALAVCVVLKNCLAKLHFLLVKFSFLHVLPKARGHIAQHFPTTTLVTSFTLDPDNSHLFFPLRSSA
jgi:hypothetical protein